MRRMILSILSGVAIVGMGLHGAAATTLDNVKKAKSVRCGVRANLPGFSTSDGKGHWSGFNVDFCRAVAAAIFNDPSKVTIKAVKPDAAIDVLRSGEIDLLADNTAWTMSHDTWPGVAFAAVRYYDGQGFMIRKEVNVNSALQLSGASICVGPGPTIKQNLAVFFQSNNMKTDPPMTFKTEDAASAAYEAGQCDVYAAEKSVMYAQRMEMKAPENNVILPEAISLEPLSVVVRDDDSQWLKIVRWIHSAIVTAEAYGVTQKNAEGLRKDGNAKIKRLLGSDGDLGKAIGLGKGWAYNIVKDVGNYGEVFSRDLGQQSKLKIERGLNALWTKGGLQYGKPIR